MTAQTEDQKFDFHHNAAALIVAAAQKSGLLREVANALRYSNDNPGGGDGCLACGVLEELIEEFRDHSFPGYDFYGEGFCVPDYSDEELRPYLHVPFAPPQIAGATDSSQPVN